MWSTKVLFAGVLLALVTTGCGADNPDGTISQDDLPGDVEVAKTVNGDDQAGQVVCTDVNNAEDNLLMTPSPNYEEDKRAAVTYELKGSDNEAVSDSVWRIKRARSVVDSIGEALEKCVEDQPDVYARFDVPGYPDALGYTESGTDDAESYTRRILVPLSDRVVILTSTRDGGDDLSVAPEDLVKKAVAASKDAAEA